MPTIFKLESSSYISCFKTLLTNIIIFHVKTDLHFVELIWKSIETKLKDSVQNLLLNSKDQFFVAIFGYTTAERPCDSFHNTQIRNFGTQNMNQSRGDCALPVAHNIQLITTHYYSSNVSYCAPKYPINIIGTTKL